jgi:hypothetical protein
MPAHPRQSHLGHLELLIQSKEAAITELRADIDAIQRALSLLNGSLRAAAAKNLPQKLRTLGVIAAKQPKKHTKPASNGTRLPRDPIKRNHELRVRVCELLKNSDEPLSPGEIMRGVPQISKGVLYNMASDGLITHNGKRAHGSRYSFKAMPLAEEASE